MAPGTDRLSDLPAGVVGTILSCLPIKEAARAAVLSRRWRHAFAEVDAVSFVDHNEPIYYAYDDDCTFRHESSERRSRNGDLIDVINSALLCRRRCAGHRDTAPPRSFRLHFRRYDCWDETVVNQWLRYLLKPRSTGQQALTHLDLRLKATVPGEHFVAGEQIVAGEQERRRRGGYTDEGECPAHIHIPYEAYLYRHRHRYMLPTRLFSHAALRTLCLGGCVLDPPKLIHLPLLETLILSNIGNYSPCGDRFQRLISACPRLVDLTLERCGYTEKSNYYEPDDPGPDKSYTISVLNKHLRKLAIRCCHNLVRVSIDASELRVFEYRGAVPAESFLTLNGAHKITSCTVDFCGQRVYKEELPRFRKLLDHFTDTKHLHLASTHLGADIEGESFPGFPSFPRLKRLELTGYLHRGSIEAIIKILEQAPSIEVSSLFMKPTYAERLCGVLVQSYELLDEFSVADVLIPCLRNRVREINLVHYQGHETQKNVAKLLLCNAMVLERVCVVFPRGRRELQTRLMNEIDEWVVNKSANKIFL